MSAQTDNSPEGTYQTSMPRSGPISVRSEPYIGHGRHTIVVAGLPHYLGATSLWESEVSLVANALCTAASGVSTLKQMGIDKRARRVLNGKDFKKLRKMGNSSLNISYLIHQKITDGNISTIVEFVVNTANIDKNTAEAHKDQTEKTIKAVTELAVQILRKRLEGEKSSEGKSTARKSDDFVVNKSESDNYSPQASHETTPFITPIPAAAAAI